MSAALRVISVPACACPSFDCREPVRHVHFHLALKISSEGRYNISAWPCPLAVAAPSISVGNTTQATSPQLSTVLLGLLVAFVLGSVASIALLRLGWKDEASSSLSKPISWSCEAMSAMRCEVKSPTRPVMGPHDPI